MKQLSLYVNMSWCLDTFRRHVKS
uniref:Uncharacterized protein n=1 Tax=Anguilla anguilla TaxID=7936 RepID=A0A0E9W1H4_ANGAN